MIRGQDFESNWVTTIVSYSSSNNTEAIIDFIENHSDEQLIWLRSELKE